MVGLGIVLGISFDEEKVIHFSICFLSLKSLAASETKVYVLCRYILLLTIVLYDYVLFFCIITRNCMFSSMTLFFF